LSPLKRREKLVRARGRESKREKERKSDLDEKKNQELKNKEVQRRLCRTDQKRSSSLKKRGETEKDVLLGEKEET